MEVFLPTVILAVALVGIGFAGIAVKILLKKHGKFSGTCASNSPFLNREGEPCSFCGALPDEKCRSEGKKGTKEEFNFFINDQR